MLGTLLAHAKLGCHLLDELFEGTCTAAWLRVELSIRSVDDLEQDGFSASGLFDLIEVDVEFFSCPAETSTSFYGGETSPRRGS